MRHSIRLGELHGIPVGLHAGAPLLAAGLADLAVVNAVIAVFNLLPGAPLDGGRVLAAVLWRWRGNRTAARVTAARGGVTLGMMMVGAGLVLTFAVQSLAGLWLVLLGWYLSGTASREAAEVRLLGGVGDLPLRRLMTSPAVCGHTGQTVSAFVAGVASALPHRCYPVVDIDGRLAGLVTTAGLAGVPEERRAEVRLGQILVPAERTPVAPPDLTLRDGAALPVGPLRCLVVVEDGRPCGVLTTGDVMRALAVAELGGAPDRSPDPVRDVHRPF